MLQPETSALAAGILTLLYGNELIPLPREIHMSMPARIGESPGTASRCLAVPRPTLPALHHPACPVYPVLPIHPTSRHSPPCFALSHPRPGRFTPCLHAPPYPASPSAQPCIPCPVMHRSAPRNMNM